MTAKPFFVFSVQYSNKPADQSSNFMAEVIEWESGGIVKGYL
jgi:hypothetical protein